jgi:chromatin remodeling complex protein RSC6
MTNKTNDIEQYYQVQDDTLYEQFNVIVQKLSEFKTSINTVQQLIKGLEKNVIKQMKGLKKEAYKNKNKGNRKPSGFAKPTKVTKELCEFMKKEEGAEIARTEVTKALVNYIKDNKLENKDNNKIICPDEKLKTLLTVNDAEELTYFNIQKFMNKHFLKNVAI